jgi:hypothetical protein
VDEWKHWQCELENRISRRLLALGRRWSLFHGGRLLMVVFTWKLRRIAMCQDPGFTFIGQFFRQGGTCGRFPAVCCRERELSNQKGNYDHRRTSCRSYEALTQAPKNFSIRPLYKSLKARLCSWPSREPRLGNGNQSYIIHSLVRSGLILTLNSPHMWCGDIIPITSTAIENSGTPALSLIAALLHCAFLRRLNFPRLRSFLL